MADARSRLEKETAALLAWASAVQASAASPFAAARQLSRRLGAHYDPDTGHTSVGFWVPDVDADVWLEWFRPQAPLDWSAPQQTIRCRRHRGRLSRQGECVWGVFAGLQAGRRDRPGDFYWLVYQDAAGAWQRVVDPLAASVPFGAFAPAELYDVAGMQAARTDAAYFSRLPAESIQDGIPRLAGPTNILQLHVNTAVADGTLAGLTRLYRDLAAKVAAGAALTPADQNYLGYDAVQLMPIEPTIEFEAGPRFWQAEASGETVTVHLTRPHMTNWGYDVITVASPAPNPAVLASGRPDELVDFIAALHQFPGRPIRIIFDIVYGHADNQSLALLNPRFIASAGMYGQNLAYQEPMVRAILLEMQRRKSNYGVDGIRVDGAQDFKYWDAEAGQLRHDDEYLRLMNDLVQDVAGVSYRPWMIFEDGRPWPRADWELASSYREVTRQLTNVVQWGPLTFAHNTPFLFTFWISKWWRIQEIARLGSHWITGCDNHDTLRRGTQVDPQARINTYLGQTLPEIFRRAYDNPAARLFDDAFMPGIPMHFINAAMRAPWSFIRNTDDRYGVKVVSEESRFLDWVMTPALFARETSFPRLKALGFTDLGELKRTLKALDHIVQLTDDNLPAVARLMQAVDPPLPGPDFTARTLKQLARDWMDDVHDLCNVSHYAAAVPPAQAAFNLAAREFRRARPWLRYNLGPGDSLAHRQPADGAVLFYGRRRAPEGDEQILFVANMEGEPCRVTPLALPIPGLEASGWRPMLVTPGLAQPAADRPLTLQDSQGVVFVRRA